jgi:hypothetical protein
LSVVLISVHHAAAISGLCGFALAEISETLAGPTALATFLLALLWPLRIACWVRNDTVFIRNRYRTVLLPRSEVLKLVTVDANKFFNFGPPAVAVVISGTDAEKVFRIEASIVWTNTARRRISCFWRSVHGSDGGLARYERYGWFSS